MSQSNEHNKYALHPNELKLIAEAIKCLEERLKPDSKKLNNTEEVSDYLRLNLAIEPREVFGVLFLNNGLRLLAFEKLFYGAIGEAQVYPRIVVQKALEYNASAIIVAHNHPSGKLLPSIADKEITQELKKVLDLIDVCLIDHFIVTHHGSYSFVKEGLL